MEEELSEFRPTPERPFLVGLLVDVSGSMMSSIENRSGNTTTRLESFRDALEDLVRKAGDLSRERSTNKVLPLMSLFAYGFGFGGLLSVIFRSSGQDVRDLFALPDAGDTTVPLDRLVSNWSAYRTHVEGLATEMLGNTPMGAGFRIAQIRFRNERANRQFTGNPVLFVLSDGEPTDAKPEQVAQHATELKADGVTIVSCYVTSDNVADPRRLYGSAQPGWPAGARLMLDCASTVPAEHAFADYLREYRWSIDPGGRLFTQINQSEVLAEFMSVILSPLRQRRSDVLPKTVTRVFVSYSHADEQYVGKAGLLGYLTGLEREGFEFWHDHRLVAGDVWDAEIRKAISDSDIAIVLVSQAFLNSAYCLDVEVTAFLERRAKSGLTVFPVIVAPCDWKSHAWLRSMQFEPRDGRTIETHYKDRGSREELYLRILEQLRVLRTRIRANRLERAG